MSVKYVGEDALLQNIEETKEYVRANGKHTILDIDGDALPIRSKLRFRNSIVQDDSLNDETIIIPQSGSGLALADVSGASATTSMRTATIKWSDPDDVIVSGVTLAEWMGTLVVRKAGSAPASRYDGDIIVTNTTRNQYASNGYTDTGLTYGTTYYYRFFPYTTQGLYTDGSSVNVAPSRIPISLPTVADTLVYDTTEQTMTFNGYDTTKMIGSGMSGTNADDYTATFTPLDDYMWSDSSTTAKTVAWSIAPKSVSVPNVTGSFTFDGTEKTCAGDAFDTAEVEQDLLSVTSSIDAGTFHVYFDLTNSQNYIWTDNTTTTKDKTWSIAKASATCTLSKDTVTLNTQKLSDTVTVTGASGTVTVDSSSTDVQASYSSGTITITALGNDSGTATVTVSVAESKNYNSGSFTITVNLSFVDSVLNNNDWATISNISSAGTASTYWNVGDTKEITLNGTVGTLSLSNVKLWVFILGFNHNSSIEGNGITFGCFKTAQTNGTDVCLVDSAYNSNKSDGTKCFNMNHWGSSSSSPYNTNYGGWAACDMRYDILGSTNKQPSPYGSTKTTSATGTNPTSTCATSPVSNTLMAALPSELRAVLKPITKYTDNKGNSSNVEANVTTTIDYLPLLSEYEVQGARTYANQYEYTNNKQKQYSYYANNNPKIKYKHSSVASSAWWWCRSARSGSSLTFCTTYTDGSANLGNSRYSYGVAPCFLV